MSGHIFWLSSYPKSGNTLLRSILISLFFTQNGKFEIENFKQIKQFDICKLIYENKKIFESDYSKINKIEILYKYLLDLQTRKSLKIEDNNYIFLKTHSGLFNILNNTFTNEKNTLGFFYIIRDPRDVCISWSRHWGKSIEETLEFMTNENQGIQWYDNNKKPYFNNLNRPISYLSSWDRHVTSWTQTNWKIPYKVLRFEDLVYDKRNKIIEIINFFEKKYSFKFSNIEEKISNILKSTDFKKLKKEEIKKGFNEASKYSNFFLIGKKNQWKKILYKKQIEIIEKKFRDIMIKYNYKLSIK